MYALEVKSLTKDYGLDCGVWYLIGYIIGSERFIKKDLPL